MMRLPLIFFFAIVLGSCGNNMINSNGKDPGTPMDTIVETVAPAPEYPLATVKNDSLIVFDFGPNDTVSAVSASIMYKGAGKNITCSVNVHASRKLEATLTPESEGANIRFNQIITPAGNADGPFGKTLNYKLSKQGTYQVIIAESLMAGDEWKGKLLVTMSLRK